MLACVRACECVYVCVRAYVRACPRARACVRACVRMCVRVSGKGLDKEAQRRLQVGAERSCREGSTQTQKAWLRRLDTCMGAERGPLRLRRCDEGERH